ncbi:MAG: NAD-binding protein [Candidatus Omnitrophota bacterium]
MFFRRKYMYILIVGGGNVGYAMAKRLRADKHVIALIEKDREICERIAKELNILVIHGDGCEPRYLEEAGIGRADVVAAVTGEDEDNLIICQLAKETYHISRTVGKVNESENEHTFSELGVDVPIDATAIISTVIEEEVSFSDIVNLMTFKRGKLSLVRVDLNENSPVVNKSVKDIQFPDDSVLVSIIRGDDVIIPRGNTIFSARDDIIALTTIKNRQRLLKLLVGEVDEE